MIPLRHTSRHVLTCVIAGTPDDPIARAKQHVADLIMTLSCPYHMPIYDHLSGQQCIALLWQPAFRAPGKQAARVKQYMALHGRPAITQVEMKSLTGPTSLTSNSHLEVSWTGRKCMAD